MSDSNIQTSTIVPQQYVISQDVGLKPLLPVGVIGAISQSNVENIQQVREQIDNEYNIKPHGGSNTPWIILGLAIALLIIFGIMILVFFLVFNPPAMHEISVVNNCTENVNVLFGVVTHNQSIDFFPVVQLSPRQVIHYRATPGTSVIVQGYRDGDTFLVNAINPFTTAELTFAGEGFGGKHQVIYDNEVITNVHITANTTDKYGVSVQGGYNIPINISYISPISHGICSGCNQGDIRLQTVATDGSSLPRTNFTCTVGPIWNHTINATGPNKCPDELQSPGTGSNYEVCLNPCTTIGGTAFCCTEGGSCSSTGGCESLWPTPEYYSVFERACPNCLITNCDNPQFICNSNRSLTSYIITFCP